MMFTVEAGALLEGLRAVHGRAKGNNLEILRHIRFDVAGGSLTLLGHEVSSSSEAVLQVENPADGRACLPADAVVRLTASVPRDLVMKFKQEGLQVSITAGRSLYKLPVLPVDGFPDALPCDDGRSVDLSGDDVVQLFIRAREALDPKDARPFATGVYLHSHEGSLSSAALSLYHFARHSAGVKLPELAGVVVPMSASDEIARIGSAGGRLTLSERSVAFEAKGQRYCSRLVDTGFPVYSNYIPALGDSHAEIDRAEFLAAVRRLACIAEPESAIDLHFGEAEITAKLSGRGEGQESISCTAHGEIDPLISVTAARLIQFLEMPKSEVVNLYVYGPKMLMRIVDPKEPEAILLETTRVPRFAQAAA